MIKQIIKRFLQERQRKEYRKELASQLRDYDSWIRGQEAPLLVSGHATEKSEETFTVSDYTWKSCLKCLTNESKTKSDDGPEMENAGKDAELFAECISYQVFHKKHPDSTKSPVMTLLSMKAGQFLELQDRIKDGAPEEDILLLNFQDGEYSELAIPMITEAFSELRDPEHRNPDETPALVYGDEDVIMAGKRQNPWFKPDWSPDTFLSCFYFGAFVAVPTIKMSEFLQKHGVAERTDREVEADLFVDGGLESELQQGKQEDRKGKVHEPLDPDQVLYELLADYLRENGAFTGWKMADHVVVHIPQVLVHTKVSSYEHWKNLHLSDENVTADIPVPTVSVIIPSKDHPDILFRCLDSFVDKTSGLWTKVKTEFIIADNGSSKENKNRIGKKLQELGISLEKKQNQKQHQEQNQIKDPEQNRNINNTRYLYKELSFNFSYMCNWGAKEAQGDYLLFLNDDMEIVDADWLILLMEKAVLPYVGAVGAKLLYPDTDIIQHAGITNLRVGPAHKLQFAHDKEDHYFGQNRGVHDMLGVTGACLLVKKTIFEKVGGFDETLAVAFNDVDLCYKIYEEGYYNVVRNDLFLFHHESLSRGKDGESEEKQLRLLREKDYLYEKHQDLYGKDPFYHPYLTTDMLETEYTPAFRYQVDLSMPWAKVKECTQEVLAAREDECLVIGMECAMDIYKWKYGVSPEKRKNRNLDLDKEDYSKKEKDNRNDRSNDRSNDSEDQGYYFQGYSFVIGSDNACYKKELLLRRITDGNRQTSANTVEEDEKMPQPAIYSISIEKKCREDIKANLKDQVNVDLTGYAAKLKPGAVPAGKYQFGMLAKDACSRVRLVNWSSWTIEIV
jgi:GT2 family glycosyltransferase